MRNIRLSYLSLRKFLFVLFLVFAQLVTNNKLVFSIQDRSSGSLKNIQLSNGMKVYVLERSDAAKITMLGIMRTGSAFEPPEKLGMANLLGNMLRSGGTKTRSASLIDEELDKIGTELFIKISLVDGQIKMTCGKAELKRSLEILGELLIRPSFDDHKLKIAKNHLLDNLKRQKEDMDYLAFSEFQKLLYGNNSPYARVPDERTINQITQQDIFKFYDKFIHPENVSFAIWGDCDFESIKLYFNDIFGHWPKSSYLNADFPIVGIERRGSVNLINRKNASLSKIRMGHLGVALDNNNPYKKEYVALIVLDLLFGGQSFSSRLYRVIRTEMGLSYDIFSMYWPSFHYPGAFLISASTKNDATVRTINRIIDELRKLCKEDINEITEDEVNQVKRYLINSYAQETDSPDKTIARALYYERQGLPLDYYQYIIGEISSVNAEDVKKAAVKFLHPENLCILVIGDEEKFDSPLAVLGKVNIINE